MRESIIILLIFFSILVGKDFQKNIDNRFSMKLNLMNFTNYSVLSDSIDIPNKSSVIKPIAASFVIPGLGQFLNKSPLWKTALFVGVEIAGIVGYTSWTNKANDITKEYENWGDDHWDIGNWISGSSILLSDIQSSGYLGVNDVKVDGSHHITIIVNGKYESSEILLENPGIDFVELRDWDFYEGIGKYDQFVAGWDDARSNWRIVHKTIKDGEDELIVMTPNKQHYLGLRNDSNILYKNAKFAASALLFNHIFSALDALWNVNKNKELSYKLDVSIGLDSIYVIKGISVQWNL